MLAALAIIGQLALFVASIYVAVASSIYWHLTPWQPKAVACQSLPYVFAVTMAVLHRAPDQSLTAVLAESVLYLAITWVIVWSIKHQLRE